MFYLLGLLLPYITYDEFIFRPDITSPASFGSDMDFVKGAKLMSYESLLGYISIVWMLYPLFKILRDSQYALRYAFISTIALLAFYVLLYNRLTENPSWYKSLLNVKVSLGYWINVHGTILCLLSIGAIWLRKKRLSIVNETNSELLDDSI